MASYNQFNYNYRPGKSIERKIFIELLRELYGVSSLAETTYIGLGSIFFIDFKLIHKELGIKSMLNIEANIEDVERFEYNKPFESIKLLWGYTYEVLPSINWEGNKIIWLDYDQTLQPYMFEDIETVFTRLATDSFYMVTCNSSMHRYFNRAGNVHDGNRFKQDFEYYAPYGITPDRLTNSNSPFLIRQMFTAHINYILSNRNAVIEIEDEKLVFCQLLFITYKDGAPMFTLGGVLKRRGDLKRFVRSNFYQLPYIRTGEVVMDLETPILTSAELSLLNKFLPSSSYKFSRNRQLTFIPTEEKVKYLNIYRHYPSYVEMRDY